MIFVVVLIILYNQSVASSNNNRFCPSDKPYYNDVVGCIFECPKPFYINGNDCVSDCGEMVVDEHRNCIDSCPDNTFYKEEIKQVMSKEYLERKCVRCDRYDQFVSNTSCVKVCPDNLRYIDIDSCVSECPEHRWFKMNTTILGLLHQKCVEKCPYMYDGEFCRNNCPSNKVVFNSTCLENCPSVRPFISSKHCLSKCPDDAPAAGFDNKTCVHLKCPDERQFVVNSTCVDKCPSESPLFFFNYNGNSGFNFCLENCGDKYKNGDQCVDTCPLSKVAVNDTCLEKCPRNTPYSCMIKKGFQCGEKLEQNSDHAICVFDCPHSMLSWNKTCVGSCPYSRYIDVNNCVSECPEDRRFKLNTTISGSLYHRCVENCSRMYDGEFCRNSCPSNKVVFNSTCLENCPSDRPYIFSKHCLPKCPDDAPAAGFENKTCVHLKCPDERQFVVNSTCVDKCPSESHLIFFTYKGNSGYNYCVKNCGDRYKNGDQCVDTCPLTTVAVNGSCLEECPRKTPYSCMIKKGFQCGEKLEQNSDHTICVDACPPSMLSWNKKCVASCPSGVPLFGKECTDTCPVGFPYRQNITKTINCIGERCEKIENVLTCINKCTLESYISNYSCLSYCPSSFIIKGRECVLKCPVSKPLVQNVTISLHTWTYRSSYYWRKYIKQESKKIIQVCVAVCDNEMLRFNSTCVAVCPDDYPIIHNGTCSQQKCTTKYTENIATGIICVDGCKPHQFLWNKICVDACPGIDLHFNGTCVVQCPQGHSYIGRSVKVETCLDTIYCSGNIILNDCIAKCRDESFEYNGTCVSFCKPPLFTLGRKCVASCPADTPYPETSSISITSWTRAGDNIHLWKDNVVKQIVKCKENCPDDKLVLGTDCIDMCPLRARFVINGSCTSDSCNTKYIYYTLPGNRCFHECPQYLFIHKNTCVSQCPGDRYALGRNCISACPSTNQIVNDIILGKEQYNCSDKLCAKSLINVKECREKCPENKFLFNDRCLDICLNKALMYKQTCVEVCPVSHPYTEPTNILIMKWKLGNSKNWYLTSEKRDGNKCVSKCSNKYPFQFKYLCMNKCTDKSPFSVDNTCVDKCPENKLLDISTKQCVDNCANDNGLFNKSCHHNCPENVKYIFDSRCVSKCPSSNPVALKEERFICRKSCDGSKLFKDGECVYSFECKDPMFDYDGLCLHRCPEGFVWFVNCNNTLPVKIAIPLLGVLLILLFAVSRQSLIDFMHVIWLMFLSKEAIKEMEDKQKQPRSKNKQTYEPEDEIPLQDFFQHAEIQTI